VNIWGVELVNCDRNRVRFLKPDTRNFPVLKPEMKTGSRKFPVLKPEMKTGPAKITGFATDSDH